MLEDLIEPPAIEPHTQRWRDGHDARMTAVETKLDRVEASTSGIVDMMESWNGAMKTIEAIGKALRPITWIVGFCTAMIGLWATIKHGWNQK